MGQYAQIIIGPAGSGKSTFCTHLYEHCISNKRIINIGNLDPAASQFDYPVSIDIRNLVTLEDVMTESNLGPNGGLMYCMELLEDNIEEWLAQELEAYGEDDYLVFDCPGQIEFYSHVPVFRTLIDYLQKNGWKVCAVYLLDSHFVSDAAKFISGTLQALSAMVLLEIPHINVLSKMDICPFKSDIDEFLFPEGKVLAAELTGCMSPRYRRMNCAVGNLIDDFSMVSFIPLDITDEDSLAAILLQIDVALQYGETKDVRTRDFDVDMKAS